MSPERQGPVALSWSLPLQYPYLRRRELDSAARRASSSVTVTQVVTFVGRRNRFILSLPLHPDRREEEICPLGAPRLKTETREGPRRVSSEIRKQGQRPQSGSFGQWGWAVRLLEES